MTSNQKVAIITGGNSGIGKATAVALAKEGVKVVIVARREKEGEETTRLVKEAGSDGIFVKTDPVIFLRKNSATEALISELTL
jgi:NAD(P)-dependent dehydrogenase (short-subunit alcohol dehydrogenase family)